MNFDRFYLLLGFVFCGFAATAQDPKVIEQELYWLRYYQQLSINPKWTLHLELDERRNSNPDRQFQFFSHLHLHYKLSRQWDVALGFSNTYTNSNKNLELVVPEWRIFQEGSWLHRYSNSSIQLRLRVEERYIHSNNRIDLLDGFTFSGRYRLRMQYSFRLRQLSEGKELTGKISNEIMLQNGQVAHPFDQNRIYAAVEFPLGKKTSLEVGYLNLFQSRIDDGYYSRNILRITFYHRLSLRSKKDQQ